MAGIPTQRIIDKIHKLGDDTTYTKEQSLEFYEEIASNCDTSADALREEIRREGGDA